MRFYVCIWQLEIVISIFKDTSLFKVTIFPLTRFKSLRQQKLTLPKLGNIAKILEQKMFEALANIVCMSEYLMYMFKKVPNVHVSIRKNFGGTTIFLRGSQKLEWTQTYDPHCMYPLTVFGGPKCIIL